MLRPGLSFCLLILPFVEPSRAALGAATIHVPEDFPTIQSAIDSASNGDVIVVAPGFYLERIDFAGKAITVRSSGSDCNSVISGTNVLPSAPVVRFDSGEGPSSVLQGFTITGGLHGLGAGMLIQGASPTVIACRFVDNDAGAGIGGGAYMNGQPAATHATFVDCEFSGNSAGTGGGLAGFQASATLSRCTFANNSALAGGGYHNSAGGQVTLTGCSFNGNAATSIGAGLFTINSSPSIRNCIFRDNVADSTTASTQGGGLFHQGGSPVIAGCLFTGNRAATGAGAHFGSGTGNPLLVNCTFSLNSEAGVPPAFHGVAVFNQGLALTLTNCILWNDPPSEIGGFGTTGVSYSDVMGGHAGPHNINANPDFVAGGFRLEASSPCLDAGDSSAVPGFLLEDLGGVPRIVAPAVDMGAYERLIDPCTAEQAEFLIDCNANDVPDTCDVQLGTSSDCDQNFVPDECETPLTMDVVFIIDGSSSILPPTFALQKQGIIDCLCGPAAVIPANGTASVTVIQFSDDECPDVPLTLVDSPATAAALCDAIAALPQVSGGTALAPALEKTFEIFRTQGIGLARQVFITTDAGVTDESLAKTRCRELGELLNARICTGLVGLSCPTDNAFLQECANALQPPEPARPMGSYRCIPAGTPGEIGALCHDCIGIECPGDTDGNELVNIVDLLALLAAWGACPPPPACCPADFDHNGQVAINDLLALLAAWGPCPGSGLPPAAGGTPPNLADVMDCFQLFASQPERLRKCIEAKRDGPIRRAR